MAALRGGHSFFCGYNSLVMLPKTTTRFLALLLVLGCTFILFGQPARAQGFSAFASALLQQTTTPQPDGTIRHEVLPGESLWSIAIAYGVQIEEINRLNGLPAEAVVRPGEEIIVAPSYTPTIQPTETATPLPPTSTARPTTTPRPPTLTATQVPSETPTPRPLLPQVPALQGNLRRSVGIGMIAICALGILLVIVHGLRGK
jgi:LysM repeat protein